MSAAPLHYVGLASGLSDGREPRLQVGTPAGTLREVPLDRRQLVRIITAAAAALDHLDRQEARRG